MMRRRTTVACDTLSSCGKTLHYGAPVSSQRSRSGHAYEDMGACSAVVTNIGDTAYSAPNRYGEQFTLTASDNRLSAGMRIDSIAIPRGVADSQELMQHSYGCTK